MSFKYNETIYVKFLEATNYFNQLLANPDDISVLKKLEEAGNKNIWAKIRLAECNLNGVIKGTKDEVKNALKTLDTLTKQGVIFAKFKKAQYMLNIKKHTKKERKEAKKILLSLPSQFAEDVQHILGCYYMEKKKAKKFFESAAKFGNEAAQKKLDELKNKS